MTMDEAVKKLYQELTAENRAKVDAKIGELLEKQKETPSREPGSDTGESQ